MKRLVALMLCLCLCVGLVPLASARGLEKENTAAQGLKTLGLFRGVSETDFALGRPATRAEALVMLIRLLGQESQALASARTYPFTDVPAWAEPYVAYGYANGLTKGISATQFGTGSATCQMYTTFVLRALGYSDALGDFAWEDPFTLAASLSLLPQRLDRHGFFRADVVLMSYAALPVYLKNSGVTLAQSLINAGVFTREQYDAVYDPTLLESDPALTAEDIYRQYSDAVFYMEVQDAAGQSFASGSGFFLTADGMAATNYHVIEGASSAVITLTSGQQYKVSGVRAWSREGDWAILQVDTSSGVQFPYLKKAQQMPAAGSRVFAVGSPKGLQNSISEGIVSHASREIDGISFIQITAAISSGSSGGALFNEAGEVVGITSASVRDGQSLNLALPITVLDGRDTAVLTDLARLHGQSAAPVPAAPSTSALPMQAEAVKQIRSWIYANANDTYAGEYPGYGIRKDMPSGATVFFTLYCENDPATVQLAVDYYFSSGSAACITMDLPAQSAVTDVYYFYARAESKYGDATGKMVVHNAYFTEGTIPDFTQYTGAEYLRASDAEICVLLIKLGLSYLDALLPAMGATFTPTDRSVFGFPAG